MVKDNPLKCNDYFNSLTMDCAFKNIPYDKSSVYWLWDYANSSNTKACESDNKCDIWKNYNYNQTIPST